MSKRLDLPPRRGMNDAETASYLGRSPTWLAEHLPELEAAGFPKKLPLIGTRDRKAVDVWLDAQGGLDGSDTGFGRPVEDGDD
jgi:hypothetical protein